MCSHRFTSSTTQVFCDDNAGIVRVKSSPVVSSRKFVPRGRATGRGAGARSVVFNVDLAYRVGVDSKFGSRGDQFVHAEVAQLGKGVALGRSLQQPFKIGLSQMSRGRRVVTDPRQPRRRDKRGRSRARHCSGLRIPVSQTQDRGRFLPAKS